MYVLPLNSGGSCFLCLPTWHVGDRTNDFKTGRRLVHPLLLRRHGYDVARDPAVTHLYRPSTGYTTHVTSCISPREQGVISFLTMRCRRPLSPFDHSPFCSLPLPDWPTRVVHISSNRGTYPPAVLCRAASRLHAAEAHPNCWNWSRCSPLAILEHLRLISVRGDSMKEKKRSQTESVDNGVGLGTR